MVSQNSHFFSKYNSIENMSSWRLFFHLKKFSFSSSEKDWFRFGGLSSKSCRPAPDAYQAHVGKRGCLPRARHSTRIDRPAPAIHSPRPAQWKDSNHLKAAPQQSLQIQKRIRRCTWSQRKRLCKYKDGNANAPPSATRWCCRLRWRAGPHGDESDDGYAHLLPSAAPRGRSRCAARWPGTQCCSAAWPSLFCFDTWPSPRGAMSPYEQLHHQFLTQSQPLLLILHLSLGSGNHLVFSVFVSPLAPPARR